MLPFANSRLRLPEFLRRAFQRDQMELDSALSQMWSLLVAPATVYKMSKARKMTKNHYYRDDPAFIVLQVLFIAIATVAFGLALQARPLRILYTLIYNCGISYFAGGVLLASATWMYSNRVLMGNSVSVHEVRRDVEWQYCFDIHCNSYWPYFVFTQVVHFFLLPLLSSSSFVAQITANAIFGAAASFYLYVTFRGFLELPMLTKQQTFLYPVVAVVVLTVLASLVTRINMSHVELHYTWPLE